MKTWQYSEKTTPSEYTCSKCGATGCKLWRKLQSYLPHLLCLDCVGKHQRPRRRVTEDFANCTKRIECYTVGEYVPAVPAEPEQESEELFYLTGIPPDGAAWWKQLPQRRIA